MPARWGAVDQAQLRPAEPHGVEDVAAPRRVGHGELDAGVHGPEAADQAGQRVDRPQRVGDDREPAEAALGHGAHRAPGELEGAQRAPGRLEQGLARGSETHAATVSLEEP